MIFSVSEIKNGDEQYFESVYHALNKKLFGYFFKRVALQSLCEDLVQDTFVRLWKYRESLDETLSLEIQIFRIAKSLMIDHLRKHSSKKVITMPTEELPELLVNLQATVPETRMELLSLLIESISPARKKIVQLRLQGYSNKEIAENLSVSVRTIENNLNLAYKDLREKSIAPACLLTILVLPAIN